MNTRTIVSIAALSMGAVAFAGSAEAGQKWNHHNHWGHAAAFGAVGFAAGAMVGAAIAQPQVVYVQPYGGYGSWVAYCSAKYQSYNPHTNKFIGWDGHYHTCK